MLPVLSTIAHASNSTSSLVTPETSIVCRPARWTDIIVFYLGNYVVHAATTLSLPGQSSFGILMVTAAALSIPTSGVFRGYRAIRTGAVFAKTELQTAARAGALCMVVKDPDEENPRDTEKQIKLLSTSIHGSCYVQQGYRIMIVPPDAEFENDTPTSQSCWKTLTSFFRPEPRSPTKLSCNYSFVKASVALGQTIFAVTTLYQTRGDQIEQFGFAAFGLTVAPYAFMSVVNLVGNLVCPKYPAMFLVDSKSLQDLRKMPAQDGNPSNSTFDGVVGRLTEAADTRLAKLLQNQIQGSRSGRRKIPASIMFKVLVRSILKIGLAAAVPLAIIGGLSGFHNGSSSTYSQRSWIKLWIFSGIVAGGVILIWERIENRQFLNARPIYVGRTPAALWHAYVSLLVLIYAIPAIGGFVVVGQMITEFGVCTKVL